MKSQGAKAGFQYSSDATRKRPVGARCDLGSGPAPSGLRVSVSPNGINALHSFGGWSTHLVRPPSHARIDAVHDLRSQASMERITPPTGTQHGAGRARHSLTAS